MKNNKNKIISISIIVIILISSFIFYFFYNKNNINNLQFTTDELKLYKYDENALEKEDEMNEEGVLVSSANDLKDYYNGYQIKLSELKPLEDYFNIDIVYFLVNYSTTDKDAIISIGLKSKENVNEKNIESFIDWIEKNEKSYIGKNDLKYKSVNIEVMKDYKKEFNAGDYSDSYLREDSYLTDENVIQQIYGEKNQKIMISNIYRISQIEKSNIENKKEYIDMFSYKVEDILLDDLKYELNVSLKVDKEEINKLEIDDLIDFSIQFEKINKEINKLDDLIVNINLIDKENYQENTFLFNSTNNRIFIKNKFLD